jgi:4-amino-4-deoxy-L-arabinose transferase-like glycosyltransferase
MVTSRSEFRFSSGVVAICGVALVLRALFALLVPVVPTQSDPTAYVTFARSLASGDGFGWGDGALTAFWPPGPSAVYAALFTVFGDHLAVIAWFHVLVGTATVLLTMVVVRQYYSERIATVAGLLIACWPLLIQFTTIPSSEPTFLLLVLCSIITWGNGQNSRWSNPLLRGPLVGALLAAASLTRPTALLLPVVLAFAEAVRIRKITPPTLTAAIASVVMLALLAPWAYRNHQVLGKAFLTSSSGSANTWLGNNDRQLPTGVMWPPEVRGLGEAKASEYYSQEVRRFVRENPFEFVRRCVVRFFRVHERESIGVVWNDRSLSAAGIDSRGQMAIKVATNLYYWPVLLLALIGIWHSVRQKRLLFLSDPLALLWLYFALVHAATVVQDRYHYPSIPAMAALAAVTITRLWPKKHPPAAASQKLGTQEQQAA